MSWTRGQGNAGQPRRVTVIAGPPCAGKNTFIAANAQPGDVVVDFDQIMHDLTGLPLHVHDPERMAEARAIRDRQISDLIASGKRGWIIATGAAPETRHAYGLPVVAIVPPADTTYRRTLAERPDGWADYLRAWYRDYEPDPRDVTVTGDVRGRQLNRDELTRLTPDQLSEARARGQLQLAMAGAA